MRVFVFFCFPLAGKMFLLTITTHFMSGYSNLATLWHIVFTYLKSYRAI